MTTSTGSSMVTLTGADYSVYNGIFRLALQLKGVPFDFEPLDVFAGGGREKARHAGHPFGKIPVLRHHRLTLYETLAITRYIDDQFEGPPLQPKSPLERARMNQIISLVDTQVYPVLVWGLHVPKSEGREPAPGMLKKGRAVLSVLETMVDEPWLCGGHPTLADAYLAACMGCILDSEAGSQFPHQAPRLWNWWLKAQTLPPPG